MLDARRALSSHDASRESPKHVQVWVQGCALPLQPADVQRAGVLRNSMRLTASQSGESAAAVPLSTQVKVVDGTTVLTVRSRVAVHNHTHLECEVLVPGRAVGDDPVLVGTVQAHAAFALPPEHSTASVLHLRPVRYRTDDDEELPLRHTAFDSISLRTNQEHEVLARCQGGDGANALPYNLVLWSRLYTRLDGAYKVLSLRPPAEVTNGLPRSVAVRVVQGGHHVALPLEPGASCPVYAASCLMDTAMSVELEGYAPSALPSLKAFISEAKSDGGKSMSETRLRLAQQLADGRSSSTRDGALYCSVEYSAHFAVQAAGQKASNRTSLPRVSMVLFASHWLVDNSGFGLSYGLAGATGKVKAAETGQVVEELFEQQRCFNFFSGKYETQHWLAPHGQPSSKAEVEARLPAGWSWTGPWVVHVGEGLGPEGFDYAFDYPEFKRAGRTPQGKKGANSWVRQRKWLRTRAKTAPAAPATPGVDDLGTASSDPDAVTMVHLSDKYSALQVRHGTGTWCTGTDLTSLMGAANLVVPVDSGMLAQLSSPGQTRRGRSGTLQPASAGQSTASLSAEGQLPHALNLVSWQRPATAPFHRSKVVTISPALWIVNACPSHLKWCYTPIKRRSKPERIFDVNPGEAVPMHMDISDRLASDCLPYISVCPDIAMGSWSCPFPVGMQEELPITVPIVDAGSTRNPAGVLPAGHIVLGASCKPHDTIPNSYVLVITQCTQFPQCAAPNSTAQARPTSTVPPLSQEEADAALKEGVPAVVPATMTIRNTTDAVLLYKQVGAVRVSDEGRRVPAAYYAALPGEVAAVGWEQLYSEATREFGMRFVSAEAWDAAGAQSPCAELPPRALSAEMQVAPDRLGQRAVVTVPGATRSSPAQRLAVSVKVAARTVELLAHDADETALAVGSGAATGSGAAASVDSAASGSQDVLENAYERDGASLLGQAAFAHAVMHGQWGALAADQMWDDVHSLSLAGLGLSLVDYRPSETLYLSMDHVQLLRSKDRTAYRLSLKVLHLQLDDMAADSSYPSVVTSLTAASAAIREHAQCQSLGRDTSPSPQALAETMATALKAGLSRAALELSVVRVRHPRKMLLKGVALQIAPLRVAASYALILSSLLQGVVVQHSVQSAAMAAELQAKLRGGADRVVADSVARAVPAATLGDAAGTGGTGAVPLRRTLELLFPSSSHLDSIQDSTRAWMLGGDVDMLQDGTSEPPGALTSTDPAAVLAGLHAASTAAGGTQPMAALGVRLDHLLSGGSEGSVLSAVLAGRMPLFIERLSILPVQLLLSYKYAGLGEGMSAPQEAVQSVDAAFHHTVGRYLRTSLTLNDAPVGVPAFQENHTLRTLGATMGRCVEFARGHSMSPAALAGIITSSNAFGRTGEYFRRATSNLASGDARLSHTLRLLSLGADVAGGTLDVVSRGIASATGDTASLAATEADRQRFEQENTGVGVVKDLGMGIFRGVAGVFTKPAEGAASGGVAGFAKGLGQGVLGLAASPLMGISTATRRIASGVNRG
ncbi:vps13B, partial [Symbiodinium sp. KB8]